MNGRQKHPMIAAHRQKASLGFMVAIILVGWGLAMARLGERSFWADEGFTAYLAQRAHSGLEIASVADVNPKSPLHVWVATWMIGLSRSEMVLRFPAAVAAVLTLPLVYVLGRKLVDQRTGIAAAFLLAVSPFTIGYAQEARPLALLELFACLSLLCLLQAMEKQGWIWWAGYALSTTLLVYTHYFAWLVLAAELVYAVPFLIWRTWQQRKLDRRAVAVITALTVVVLLYLPWAPNFLTFLTRQGADAGLQELSSAARLRITTSFLRQMVWFFGAKRYGWQLTLFLAGFLLGTLSLSLRKRWRSLFLIVAWFATPLAALALVPAKHPFNYRYLIFMVPLFLLMTAAAVARACSLCFRTEGSTRAQVLHPLVTVGLTALLFVPAILPALREHIRWEKENWRGIGGFVQESFLDDEAIHVAPLYWSYPLLFYQPTLEPYLVGGPARGTSQLEHAVRRSAGLWFLRTANPLGDPTGELTTWVNDTGFELLIDGFQCGWGIHVYYRRADDAAAGRHAELLRLAEAFCPSDPRFRAHNN